MEQQTTAPTCSPWVPTIQLFQIGSLGSEWFPVDERISSLEVCHGGCVQLAVGVDGGAVVVRVVWTQTAAFELFLDGVLSICVPVVTAVGLVRVGAAYQEFVLRYFR